MLENYPETSSDQLNKDFSHKRSEITKQILTTKLKAICIKFRQAVDLGRKNGSGRVVFQFCNLREVYGVAYQLQSNYHQDWRAQTWNKI